MSIFGVKDLDYKFTEFIDDKTLFSLYMSNKYYYNIFDDIFWKRRFYLKYRKYIHVDEKYINNYFENWKDYYFITVNLLNNGNLIQSLYDCILQDNADIFSLIINIKTLNPYILFNSGNFYDDEAYNYISKKKIRFLPISLIIEKDSLNCFETFFSKEKFYNPMYYLDKAIKNKSRKIINYMISKNLATPDSWSNKIDSLNY